MDSAETVTKETDSGTGEEIRVVTAKNGDQVRSTGDSGTGYTEIIKNGKLVQRSEYKNYQLSRKRYFDETGNVLSSEWHLTRIDLAYGLSALGIIGIISVLLFRVLKRRKLTGS
jgi:hypothetical protein